MALTANDVIGQVSFELIDPDRVAHTDPEYIDALNAAVLQTALVRPDAVAITSVVTLTPGETKQSLPAGGLRFLRPRRNMGSDGSTPGAPIKSAVSSDIERHDPRWHSRTGATAIKNTIFDEIDPKTFYTYPPAHATTAVKIEIVYSDTPTLVTATGDAFPLDDVYLGPVKEWMKYLLKSAETSGLSQQESLQHRNNFYTSLDVKLRADMIVSPNTARANQ